MTERCCCDRENFDVAYDDTVSNDKNATVRNDLHQLMEWTGADGTYVQCLHCDRMWTP